MTKKEFEDLTGIKVTDHVKRWDDNWGLGQIDIDEIPKMINVGKKVNLTFKLAKTVTAFDDVDHKERTITAYNNKLFVFPSHNGDLSDFWDKVGR